MKRAGLEEKDILNPEEAIALFGLSRRKFRRMLQEKKDYGFTALYGSRILIIRTQLERFLKEHPEWKEELKNGSYRKNKDKA